MFQSPQDFINEVWPFAVNASARTGIDPNVIVAQSALETGWGRSAPGYNFFGITGPGQTQATHEFINGQMTPVTRDFRSYASAEASFNDWANLMLTGRYEGVREAGTIEGQIAALGNSGYATDPNYADSLRSIAATVQDTTAGYDGVPGVPLWQRGACMVARLRGQQAYEDCLTGMGRAGGLSEADAYARGTAQAERDSLGHWVTRGAYIGVGFILFIIGLSIVGFVKPKDIQAGFKYASRKGPVSDAVEKAVS